MTFPRSGVFSSWCLLSHISQDLGLVLANCRTIATGHWTGDTVATTVTSVNNYSLLMEMSIYN